MSSGRNPVSRLVHHWPTRLLCLFFILLQAASINWYLMSNLSMLWAAVYGADVVVITLFIASFVMSTRNIRVEKGASFTSLAQLSHLPLTYIAWLVYAVLLDVKTIVIFTTFSTNLDEASFFGPNTLKTSIAIAGLIFVSFLATQHDVKDERRRNSVISLTATVLFDILDGVDNMDNLFDKSARDEFMEGLDDATIAVCCINFLLPTVPLFTLSKTKFARRKLPEKMELLHKLAIAYIVNLPLFVIRMVTWHGLTSGISIFLLKNVIAMGVATFEVGEHLLCRGHENEEEDESDRNNGHVNSLDGHDNISNTPV